MIDEFNLIKKIYINGMNKSKDKDIFENIFAAIMKVQFLLFTYCIKGSCKLIGKRSTGH